MSRTKPTAVETAELEFSCTKCHAMPGKWCTRLGQPDQEISYLHGARFGTATRAGRLPL